MGADLVVNHSCCILHLLDVIYLLLLLCSSVAAAPLLKQVVNLLLLPAALFGHLLSSACLYGAWDRRLCELSQDYSFFLGGEHIHKCQLVLASQLKVEADSEY